MMLSDGEFLVFKVNTAALDWTTEVWSNDNGIEHQLSIVRGKCYISSKACEQVQLPDVFLLI